VTITPHPWQKNGLPIWIGGRSHAAMRRTGRLGDGWLVSSVSPAEVGTGIQAIRRYAADAVRQIPEDHYGVLIPFFFAATLEKAHALAGESIRPRPDMPPGEFIAFGIPNKCAQKSEIISPTAPANSSCDPADRLRAGANKLKSSPAR
jgi:alkanesulfonate monooxygenase SsuD/methylene tetrahydromethanopterin reductase-like flavin-dependent oxidoreductase (luciferase family)